MSALPYITAAIRWALGLLAGWLVAKGVLTSDHSAEFVNIALSMALAAVPLVWSMWQKFKTGEHLQQAASAPSGAPTPKVPA